MSLLLLPPCGKNFPQHYDVFLCSFYELDLNQQALAFVRRVHPADHPDIVIGFFNVAATLAQYREALKVIQFVATNSVSLFRFQARNLAKGKKGSARGKGKNMAEVSLNAIFAVARGLGRRCIASLYFACGGHFLPVYFTCPLTLKQVD